MIIKKHFPKAEVLKNRIHSYCFIYGDKKQCSYMAFPNTIKSVFIGIHTKVNYTSNILTTTINTTNCTVELLNNIKVNTLNIEDKAIILQINFSSMGLCHFMKYPISVLNQTFQKEDLVKQLKNITIDTKNWTEECILKRIEKILISAYKKKETKQLERAIQLIEEPFGIKKIANEVGMSYRTLHRHFKKNVGMTPSMYLRIFRLKSVLQTKENALKSFYDESHFIKEFKFFTGYTPNVYKKKIKRKSINFYYETS